VRSKEVVVVVVVVDNGFVVAGAPHTFTCAEVHLTGKYLEQYDWATGYCFKYGASSP
jgi:hypothetical protein